MAAFDQQIGAGHDASVGRTDQGRVIARAEQHGRALRDPPGHPVDQAEFTNLA
jgi:hypothetical protein